MDQCRVIAALHIDLRLVLDAIIDDNIQCVAIANRRDGAISAVSEQLSDLVFAGQVNIITELHSQFGQADVVRRRKDREYVTAVVAQNDAFGQTVAGDLADLGGDDMVGSCGITPYVTYRSRYLWSVRAMAIMYPPIR